MLHRFLVVSFVRIPIWHLDWQSSNRYQEELGPVYFGMYRALNIGIFYLEAIWIHSLWKKFRQPLKPY